MSNAPKVGFWQTLPGIMTASAGLLSTATGVLVALNQTGVVNLRELVGTKPAAQMADASTQAAPAPTPGDQPSAKPGAESRAAEARKPVEELPSVQRSQDSPGAPKPDTDKDVAETEEPAGPPPATSNPGGDVGTPVGRAETPPIEPRRFTNSPPPPTSADRAPQPIVVDRAPPPRPDIRKRETGTTAREATPRTPWEPRTGSETPSRRSEAPEPRRPSEQTQRPSVVDKAPAPGVWDKAPPTSAVDKGPPSDAVDKGAPLSRPGMREREAGTKRPDAASPATADPRRDAEPTGRRPETRGVEPKKLVEPPPRPSVVDKAAPPKPDGPEREGAAKKRERSPTSPPPPDDDSKGTRVRRHRPDDAMPSKTTGKRPAPESEPKPRNEPGTREDKAFKRGTPRATTDRQLNLKGLVFTLPAGWETEDLKASPTGSAAVLHIPKSDAGNAGGTVRITYEPNLKAQDQQERKIDQWIGRVTKPNGSSMTRADAKITTTKVGAIRLTTVDLSGTVKVTARDAGQPGQRIIAAIVDHAQGPHCAVIVGPTASMSKWDSAIDAFLKSATAG